MGGIYSRGGLAMAAANAQNENPNTPISWLKELSGIGLGTVAVLYVCGYLVHTIYYRLLGVDVGAQPLNYLTFSGDYLISILVSLPQLLWMIGEYWRYIFEHCLWLSILLCAASGVCIFVLKKEWWSDKTWWRFTLPELLTLAVCILIFFAAVPITLAEIDVFRAQNVLQPFSPVEIQGAGKQTQHEKSQPVEDREKLVRSSYQEHKAQGVSSPGFDQWMRWFSPLNANNELERIRSYLALLLVNVIFLTTLVIVIWNRKPGNYSKILVAEAVVWLALPLLLFPSVYATLGRVFLFPVVTLEIKVENSDPPPDKPADEKPKTEQETVRNKEGEQKKLETHPVFLIFQDESEVVVYDRISLFQIKRIPRSEVQTVKQLYKSSPFKDCQQDNGDFLPCETLWIKEKTPIFDF